MRWLPCSPRVERLPCLLPRLWFIVAALPVTVPLHVVSSTTGMFIGTCAFAIDCLCSTVDRALHSSSDQDDSASNNPVENIVKSVIPVLFGTVGKIKNDIGSTIMGVVAPELTHRFSTRQCGNTLSWKSSQKCTVQSSGARPFSRETSSRYSKSYPTNM